MIIQLIDENDVTDISGELLLPNGKLKLLKAEDYKQFNWASIRSFCHHHGRYGLPTVETVNLLKEIIGDRKAIEIGSGHGDLGYHLGIPMTDSKIQLDPMVRKSYEMARQPIIKYPDDVEKLEAIKAIEKYGPDVVIGSWVTAFSKTQQPYGSSPYGIKESRLIDMIETYIVIGSVGSHGDKPIRQHKHEEIYHDFILSRANPQTDNRIYIWNNESTF